LVGISKKIKTNAHVGVAEAEEVAEEVLLLLVDDGNVVKVTPYVLHFNASTKNKDSTTYHCRTELLRSRFGTCEIRPGA
jgi:hypothetical protein